MKHITGGRISLVCESQNDTAYGIIILVGAGCEFVFLAHPSKQINSVTIIAASGTFVDIDGPNLLLKLVGGVEQNYI